MKEAFPPADEHSSNSSQQAQLESLTGVCPQFQLSLLAGHQGLLRLKNWIAQHGALNLTLKNAAKLACLSSHHFSAVFHKHTGLPFTVWRQQIRLSWAVKALGSGEYSINDIISLAGYHDRRAFERAVKTHTGCTPGTIRLRHQAITCRLSDMQQQNRTRSRKNRNSNRNATRIPVRRFRTKAPRSASDNVKRDR